MMRGGAAAIVIVVVLACLDVALPPPIDRAANGASIVLDRNGAWVHAFAGPDGRWRFPVSLDAVDPAFVARLLLVEDKRFHRHPGVDFAALSRAVRDFLGTGRVVSGGSTITMQTARLLEPRPRNVGSKVIEIIRALQIERRLTKREILELYLTLAPYGGNIEGVRAASLVYLGKEPQRLSDAEQALLIALPQAPEARRPDLRPAAARAARDAVLGRLAAVGAMSPEAVSEAREAAVPKGRIPFPRAGYHAARLIADGRSGDVSSTLDIRIQRAVERRLSDAASAYNDGATAAALVVDVATGEVLASVGSHDLAAPGGWIDLTRARRSPGSLLKPFIYGFAIEDGVLGEATLIDDAPRAFGSYRPENFDRTFRGEVRVREALQHSLNVPAVAALDQVGAQRFLASLSGAGARLATRRRADSDAGLAVALGGLGVSVHDLASLYASLGADGIAPALRLHADEAPSAGRRLLSGDVAERIVAILQGTPSLEGRAPGILSADAPVVAYKTGTSYGYRDAWAAGVAGGHAVVVWVGRADGAPRPGATGRSTAAPILFSIFDDLAGATPQPSTATRSIETSLSPSAPLMRLDARRTESAPAIVFPRAGAELFAERFGKEARGFVLAASGGEGDYDWYADGAPVPIESSRPVWRPEAPGFYELTVVDGAGRSASVRVRVASHS